MKGERPGQVVDSAAARRQEAASRLKTVEGQLRAVRKMVVEGEECLSIATQAAAALESLRGAMKIILRNYMDDCLAEEVVHGNREVAFDRFVGVLERFIR
jgi:DNA-binding FrmR family transcriptional regulator